MRKHIFTKLNVLYFIYFLLTVFVAKLLFIFTPKQKDVSCKILVTANYSSWKDQRDRLTGTITRGHSIFDQVIRKFSEKYPSSKFISSYPFGYLFFHRLGLALEIGRSTRLGIFKPLECYFSWNTFLSFLRARRQFGKTWKALKKYDLIKKKLIYKQVDILSTFSDVIEYYYKIYLPLMALYFELSIEALHIEKPTLILMSNEYGGFERALLFAGHYCEVPTLAIQHGIIHSHHPGYMYAKEDISKQGSAKFPYAPIPIKTAVYGPYYKDFLTRVSGFPHSSVVITGQPRYDVLPSVNTIYNKTRFCNQYQLNPDKKIVLIATQPFPLETTRAHFFENVIRALDNFDNIQIVVKPHPGETADWHRDKLTQSGVDALVLPPTSDTYEAIYSCDLFISVSSTTILEALILNKIVVVVNISNLPELLPWVKEGAALGEYDVSKLAETFRKALFYEDEISLQDANRSSFVYRHVYKTDGKATKRVISIISNLCEQK